MDRWPLPSDYAAILQHPRIAFPGPFMRECTVNADKFGLPAYFSWVNGYSVVFHATLPSARRLAVVTFTRPMADREERYRAISDHWTRPGRPSTLQPFSYHAKGIRAFDGKLYPMVTFPWSPDESLYNWLRPRCLSPDTAALSAISDQWLAAVKDLAAADIAHGDLHHSSIRVAPGNQLRLVGYDAVYVPKLAGRPAIIKGQKPYQHPDRRKDTPLGPELDRFPALLIMTVLKGLAAEPELWKRYVETEDYDKLLIRPDDLHSPHKSALYRDLMHSADPAVARLAEALFQSFHDPLTEVPTVADVLSDVPKKIQEDLIFISAKSADYDHARRVYRFLIEQGLSAFMSDESLPDIGISDYRKAIDDALDRAKHMIVVTSSAEHVRSSWVEAEWGLFIGEKRSGHKMGNLVTLTVGDMSPTALPASLRYFEVIALEDAGALEKVFRYVNR